MTTTERHVAGHVLTLEALEIFETSEMMYTDDLLWPWPPYGISERDERERDWWFRCPLDDALMVNGSCPECGRGAGR